MRQRSVGVCLGEATMKVDELWRYPVKSMIGQRVSEVEVDTRRHRR